MDGFSEQRPLSPRDARRAHAVIGAICATYAVSCWIARPAGPLTAPDSAGYLAFAPIHALGYPLFLRLLGERAAVAMQPAVFTLALAWLGIESLRLTSSGVLAAAVVLAALTTPTLTAYHFSVLTESLFVSGTVALLAAIVRFVRAPSWRAAALAAAIVAVTATVRRTGIALLPIPLIMVTMCWLRLPARRGLILAAAIVPALAILGAERVAARIVHQDQLTSITGRQLYAKAALLQAPPLTQRSPDPLRASLEQHLDADFVPIRELIARAPAAVRGVLMTYYETCLQWPCVAELRGDVAASSVPLNDALQQVALDRIARAPLAFAALTTTDDRALWAVYNQQHPAVARSLTAFVAANRPLPFERDTFKVQPDEPLIFRGRDAVAYLQPIVIVIGWTTGALAWLGLAIAATRRAAAPVLVAACLAALTAHASLLFSALFAAGLSRFIVSLWPAITIAVMLAGWTAIEKVRARSGTPR